MSSSLFEVLRSIPTIVAPKASASIWRRCCCTRSSAWSPEPTHTGKCMNSFAFIGDV